MKQAIRQIIIPDNLVFPKKDRGVNLDCSHLAKDGVVFIGDDGDYMWVEKNPFTERITDYDFTEALALWEQAETMLIEQDSEPDTEPEPEPEPLSLKDMVTNKRWELMTGGYTLPNGTVINTTIEDQNRISSVVANAHLAGLDDSSLVDFKAATGWIQLTIGELKSVVGLIGVFTQQLYSAEKEHHEKIDSLSTEEEIANYDINQGWPSNGAKV